MESFYTNIKSTVGNVYSTSVRTCKIYLSCNAYWAQYQLDGGEWTSYGPDGKTLILNVGNHSFNFRSSAGWGAPVDFTYNVQADKKMFIIYKKTYSILMDHLENNQYSEMFYATKGD